MTTARADSWHDNGARASRPGGAPRRTPPPPLPPLPGSGGRAPRPVQRRAERPGGDDYSEPVRSRDDRLRSDLQRSRPSTPLRSGDPHPPVRSRRPGAAEPLDARPEARPPARRPAPAPRPSAPADGRLRGILAVLGIFAATLAGGAVDSFIGMGLGLLTLVTLVASTAVATLTVRRRDLVTVVLCPPLVFIAVAGVNIALAPSATLSLPTVATLLIRGFPTMAAATAAAIVLALIRLGTRR